MPRSTILERAGVDAQDFEAPITCPAGLSIKPDGIPGCLCRVEDSVISALRDPSSLVAFCLGDYTRCPSWRADKENSLPRDAQVARRRTMVDKWREGDDVESFAVPVDD